MVKTMHYGAARHTGLFYHFKFVVIKIIGVLQITIVTKGSPKTLLVRRVTQEAGLVLFKMSAKQHLLLVVLYF